MRKFAASISGIAVGVGILAAGGAPAAAASPMECVGTASNLTVNGDVVVPGGKACRLDKVTVKGNISVEGAGNLLLLSSNVTGSVTGERNSYLNSWNSTVNGRIAVSAGWGAYLAKTTMGSFLSNNGYASEGGSLVPRIYVEGSEVKAGLEATSLFGEFVDTNIGGDADFRERYYVGDALGLNRVNIGGNLWLSRRAPTVCGTTVNGETRLGMTSGVWGTEDGSCAGNHFRGKYGAYSAGRLVMNNNTFDGLATTGKYPPDTPSLTGTGNRFLGGTAGAFVEFSQRQGNSTSASVQALRATADRRGKTAKAELTARALKAEKQARTAGKATFHRR